MRLAPLVLATSMATPLPAWADTMFDRTELTDMARLISTGACSATCQGASFKLDHVAFPAATPPDRQAGRRLFVATAAPQYCGASNCPSAYLLDTGAELVVLLEGMNLGYATQIQAHQIPGVAIPAQLQAVPIASREASSSGAPAMARAPLAGERMEQRFADACAIPNERPAGTPCPFRETETCLGESCLHTGPVPLTLRGRMDLVDAPGSGRVVHRGRAGDQLIFETSEVYSVPCAGEVLRPTYTGLRPGTRVLRLSNAGEGTVRLLVDGRMDATALDEYDYHRFDSRCPAIEEQWARFRAPDGSSGWALFDIDLLEGDSPELTQPPLTQLGRTPATSPAGAAPAGEIGPGDVIAPAVQQQVSDCLYGLTRPAPSVALGCFDRPGVTPNAREFARRLLEMPGVGLSGMLIGFTETGRVDVAEVFFPMLANTNEQMVLVNGVDGPHLAAELNFRRNPPDVPSTRAIRARYPQAFESGRVAVVAVRHLPGGAQRFVLSDIVTDGCRACDPVATSLRYIDFAAGRQIASMEIGWQPWTEAPMSRVAERVRRADIAAIQDRLNRMGYEAGTVDGVAGPRTMAAFMAFKRDYCLPETGGVNAEVVSHLTATGPGFSRPGCAPGGGAGVSLPFPDGVYTSDARLCPPLSPVALDALDGLAEGQEVRIEAGTWSAGAGRCDITALSEAGAGLRMSLACLAEGQAFNTELSLGAVGEDGFSLGGRDFRQCRPPVASLPLPAGVYAHDERLCPGSPVQAPNDVVFEAGARPLVIDGTSFAWDHALCEIGTARQAGAQWALELACEGNNDRFDTMQGITLLSETEVLFDGFRRTWCGPPVEPVVRQAEPEAPLPVDLAEGVYAFEAAGCPAFDATPRDERERIAANLRVTLRDGMFTQGEQNCPIVAFTQRGAQSHLEMDCIYGETPVLYRFEMAPLEADSFQRYDDVYRLCDDATDAPGSATPVAQTPGADSPAADTTSPEEADALLARFREDNPDLYDDLSSRVGDDTLGALLVKMKIDIGEDYAAVWSSPFYRALLEGIVKIMLSGDVQRYMEYLGFPDTGYIYAFEWPGTTEVRALGYEMAMDYVFDFAIGLIEKGLEDYTQPWDGGAFEAFFDAAIPAALSEAKFVLKSISDYNQGNYVGLAVGVFVQSARTATKLHEAAILFREVRGANRDLVNQAVAGAVAAIEIQQVMGLSGQRLPALYARDLTETSDPLINGSQAWTVDAGRKLRIVGELVLIRSVQLQERDISGYVDTLNRLISEYEGTPISVWDSYANTVTFGLGGTREYASFSRDVASDLGLYVP